MIDRELLNEALRRRNEITAASGVLEGDRADADGNALWEAAWRRLGFDADATEFERDLATEYALRLVTHPVYGRDPGLTAMAAFTDGLIVGLIAGRLERERAET